MTDGLFDALNLALARSLFVDVLARRTTPGPRTGGPYFEVQWPMPSTWRPYEPPVVTSVGNMNDLLARVDVCGDD